MSQLLIDEYPLMVLPKLAVSIGLNEAIILQQIHYWIEKYRRDKDAAHFQDGRWWVYNTIEGWAENFPFWSASTIRRALQSLRDKGLVRVGSYNRAAYDKTLWYAIDYEAISKWADGCVQNGQMDVSNLSTPIPETTQETSQETTEEKTTSETDDVWPEDSHLLEGGDSPIESVEIETESDPILDLVKRKEKQGSRRQWTQPAEAGGDDPWANGPVTSFCAFAGIPPNAANKQARFFARELRKLGDRWDATPQEVARAIDSIPKSEYDWFRCGAPKGDKWNEIMDVLIPRIQEGQRIPTKAQQWSRTL